MSSHALMRRKTVADIASRKGKEPIVCLTAYDAPMASLLDPVCDLLLVGDSVGMVVHGLTSTVGVTEQMMILHGQAVMRGSQQALVVIDLPFGSYEKAPEQAFSTASRVLKETGAQAIKLESGRFAAETIEFLVARGVPVMGHVGLRPQAVNVSGGYRAKGRTDAEWLEITKEAQETAAAGAFAIVVEGVHETLAQEITASIKVPTIGIGASSACDGQVLVTEDMLGLFEKSPKFVKHYANLRNVIEQGVTEFASEVRNRSFPAREQTYRFERKGSSHR
ncbi:MAG: 3-methyl-2-oxobutanoate hydroxymethyltransferase [Pseudomonadota bacterium]